VGQSRIGAGGTPLAGELRLRTLGLALFVLVLATSSCSKAAPGAQEPAAP